jgi:hypothetical protein
MVGGREGETKKGFKESLERRGRVLEAWYAATKKVKTESKGNDGTERPRCGMVLRKMTVETESELV